LEYHIGERDVKIVMPRYDMTLAQRLTTAISGGDAKRLMIDIARGVAAVHDRGFVHMDLKSTNIMVSSGLDRVVVCDFGISKHRIGSEPVYPCEVFSLFYRPPELLMGYLPVRACPSQDVWALACVFYEILRGSPRPMFVHFRREVHISFAVVQLWRKLRVGWSTGEINDAFGWVKTRKHIPGLDMSNTDHVVMMRADYACEDRQALRTKARKHAERVVRVIEPYRNLFERMLDAPDKRADVQTVLECLLK
jgi:serine/threonine protein kinase